MSWIRHDSWFMCLLPYIIACLLLLSYVEIGNHFGEREPKALFHRIFYPKQYWQEKYTSTERKKIFLESSLASDEINLTIIRNSMKLEIEKSILSAKALGMDTYQARIHAEEEINRQIRAISLTNQFGQKELEKITTELESAKRELLKCQ